MKYKIKHKVKLTKTGKIVLSIIIGSIFGCLLFSNTNKETLYLKEETKNYTMEIKYPNINNKILLADAKAYINTKKKDFIKNTNEIDYNPEYKYDFKTSYEVSETDNTIGVHLTVYEFTGGAHYIREDKSYYYDKRENEEVNIMHFLENEDSLNRISSLTYYYIMKYSKENNLEFDESWVKEGISNNPTNFEHFRFIDEGIEFLFPPYQVAYYAAGEVKIIIPYEELVGIVKEEYLRKKENNDNKTKERNLKEFSDKKLLAFTFDDGPSYIATNKLLDNLDKYNARVTFFVMGKRVNDYKDTLKRAYNMGNLIGSHTYSHKNLPTISDYEIINEIKKTNNNIKDIIGENTLYLRPPYGNTNNNIKELSNMYTIMWDLDTEDWKYKDKNRIAKYIIDNAHDGGIVLLHDLYETSVDGALLAMEELSKEGYAFVTIEEMAKLKNINLDKRKSYYYLIN